MAQSLELAADNGTGSSLGNAVFSILQRTLPSTSQDSEKITYRTERRKWKQRNDQQQCESQPVTPD
jgi:hypothetical protein